MSDLPPTPLAEVDPDSITRLFEADPLDLTDEEIENLINELRRRRVVFLAKEAADKPARARVKPEVLTAPEAAVADKPFTELTLDDLEKD